MPANLSRSFRIPVLGLLLSLACATLAEQTTGANPKFFALPTELDIDRGAANGDAAILRVQPVYTFPINPDWKLANLTILTLADAPSGTPVFPGASGSNNKGIADLVHASFVTPTSASDLIWGVGFIASLPTATASGLGNDKWTLGPALRLTYRTGPWNIGGVAGQRWSTGGSGNKPDVNQLMIRAAIRRQLDEDWYLVSAPIIVANWDAPGEKWQVPIGGGIGRRFKVGEHPWAVSVQAYYNAIRPDGAPDWVARLAVAAAIPFGD
jgi:hypothetical protein